MDSLLVVIIAVIMVAIWVRRRRQRGASPSRLPAATTQTLEQRLRHLPVSNGALHDQLHLQDLDSAELQVVRDELRRRVVRRLRAREQALRLQERQAQQQVLAALREVQHQRFETSLLEVLPTDSTWVDMTGERRPDADTAGPARF